MVCIFAIPVNLLANFSFQTEMKILIIHFVLLLLLHIPGFRFSLVPTPLHKSTATGENTVLGLASYPKNSLKLFKRLIGSLRNSNFQGHVILGVHPTISELEVEYLKRNQVTMYVVEAVSCEEKSIPRTTSKRKSPTIRSKCAKGLETLKLEWGRYELARQWLNACEECTGWTLVLDTRDVFFQGDPFQAIDDMKLSPLTQLIFIQEISPSTSPVNDSSRSFIAGNQRSESHTVPCYGWTTFRHYSHQPVLCSGTIFGTREGMDKFLSTLVKEFHENNQKENHRCYSPSTTDQWTLNWMYYNNKFGTEPQVVTVPWGYGPVNTIGKACMTKDKKTGAGDLVSIGLRADSTRVKWTASNEDSITTAEKYFNLSTNRDKTTEGPGQGLLFPTGRVMGSESKARSRPRSGPRPVIVNYHDRMVSAVVHQFDRCGKWMDEFFANNLELLRSE